MEFTEVLEKFGIEYYTEGRNARPGWIQMNCPWCGVSGKPGLGYKIDGGYCNCYKCGGHSALAVLHELTKEPYDTLRKLLSGSAALLSKERAAHTGRLKLPQGLGQLARAHVTYLRNRGYDIDELVETWHIQALGQLGKLKTETLSIDLSWRIFIPIIWRGEMVSWTTRAIVDDTSKRYISAPSECESIPHKTILYGADYCLHEACAIEGPLDVWSFGKGGVGLLGVGYSRSQVNHL